MNDKDMKDILIETMNSHDKDIDLEASLKEAQSLTLDNVVTMLQTARNETKERIDSASTIYKKMAEAGAPGEELKTIKQSIETLQTMFSTLENGVDMIKAKMAATLASQYMGERYDPDKERRYIGNTISQLEHAHEFVNGKRVLEIIEEHIPEILKLCACFASVDSRFYSDVAIFKEIINESRQALKYLSSKQKDYLFDTVINAIKEKKEPGTFSLFAIGEKEEAIKKEAYSLVKGYRSTSIASKSTLASLRRYLNTLYKESETPYILLPIYKIDAPNDPTTKIFRHELPIADINKARKGLEPINTRISFECAGHGTALNIQQLIVTGIMASIYNRKETFHQLNGNGEVKIPADDIIKLLNGSQLEDDYYISPKERRNFIKGVNAIASVRMTIDTSQEYKKILNKKQKQAFDADHALKKHIATEPFLNVATVEERGGNGKNKAYVILKEEPIYFRYLRKQNRLISFPAGLLNPSICTTSKKGGAHKSGNSSMYYRELAHCVAVQIEYIRRGIQKSPIINIQEDRSTDDFGNQRANLYQRAGIPSPSDIAKKKCNINDDNYIHTLSKEKYTMKKRIEKLLNNFKAYTLEDGTQYIKDFQPIKKGKSIVGYKIIIK